MKNTIKLNGNQASKYKFLTERSVGLLIWMVICGIAAYLRFTNLPANPGWYSDEGTVVEIAKNFLAGRIQYLAFNESTLLAARMPLFPIFLAGIFSFAEVGITTLRYVTAGLGVCTVGLLYWVILDIVGKERIFLPITASLFLAIYPQAILYSRLGFSYNLLAPLLVGMLWVLWKYLNTGRIKWILLASLLVGVGAISDLMMFAVAPVIVLVAITKKWKDAFLTSGVIILPFTLYSLLMLTFHTGAFLFDFEFIFFRLGEIPLIAQYPIIVYNFTTLLMEDYWWSLAVIGIFIIPECRFKYLILMMFFTPLSLLARTALLPGLSFYYLSPLFPLIALGAASLVVRGVPYALEITRKGLEKFTDVFRSMDKKNRFEFIWKPGIFIASSLILFLVIISPFVITFALGIYQAHEGLKTEIDPVLVNVLDARKAIAYVNNRVSKDELVLASPALAWAIEANAADFQMAVAYQGGETKHFPTDIPANRFIFDANYNQAAYVILDPIWWNWAVPNMPEVEDMVQVVTSWPKVYSAGQVVVYENPLRNIK